MARYSGKRVMVTGGASGVGLATARLLLEEGTRVLVTGHTDATLEAARAALGPQAVVVSSDAASISDGSARGAGLGRVRRS